MIQPPNKTNIAAPQQNMGGQEQLLGVLRQAVQKETPNENFDTFMKKLAKVVKDPNNKLIQFGNTVFLAMRKPPDRVEIHTFSSDDPSTLVKNFQGLAKLLKNQGIKHIMTYADSPAYLKVAKATGLPVKTGQSTKVIKGVAKPVYTFTVDL